VFEFRIYDRFDSQTSSSSHLYVFFLRSGNLVVEAHTL